MQIIKRHCSITKVWRTSVALTQSLLYSTTATIPIYLANTSPLSTQPIMFPKCGTLLTYGRALVIKMLRSPWIGSLNDAHTYIKQYATLLLYIHWVFSFD